MTIASGSENAGKLSGLTNKPKRVIDRAMEVSVGLKLAVASNSWRLTVPKSICKNDS